MSTFFAVTVVCGSPLPLLACISNPIDSFKLLGVHITKDLPWVIHCDYVIKKANRRLYTLRNLKKSGVHPDDVVIVYCWLVRSVLEYGAAAFANLSNFLANDMENIQKCALSIIYPFTSCKDALAKTGITSFKQSCENACVNVKKRVSPENPTFSLIQSRIVQSSLAYCQRSNRSFITLPSDTDFCTNFVQMSVAVLYLPNIFFKLLMRQVPVHGLVALLQITLSRSQLLTGHFKQLSKVILKYLALSCSVSLGGALLRQSEMTFFPGPYRTSRSHLVNL